MLLSLRRVPRRALLSSRTHLEHEDVQSHIRSLFCRRDILLDVVKRTVVSEVAREEVLSLLGCFDGVGGVQVAIVLAGGRGIGVHFSHGFDDVYS